MSTMIAKITPSSIGLKPEIVKDTHKEEVLCHMLGEATGTKAKRAANGDEFIALSGKFEAINLKTGEVYRSGILFLPGGIHDMLTEVLMAEPDAVVSFGIALTAVPAKNPSGYSWKAQQLLERETHDPLAELRKRLAGHDSPLSLPAPEAGGAQQAREGAQQAQVGDKRRK